MDNAPSGFDALDEHLCRVTSELLESYGHEPCVLGPALPPSTIGQAVSAAIGFTGETALGTISILGLHEVGVLLRGDADRASVADVFGEFSNMLMGRLKNRLLAYGLDLSGALPSMATGWNLELQPGPSTASAWHEARLPAGSLYIRLEAILGSGFHIASEPLEGGEVASEGESLMF